MLTVKDAIKLLRDAKYIFVNWNGSVKDLDTDSTLEVAAYGDFLVDKIVKGSGENSFELIIKATPVKLEV